MAYQPWEWRRIDDKGTALSDLILLLNQRFGKLVQALSYIFGAVQIVGTFPNLATNPSVLGARLWLVSNTAATNLAGFTEGAAGQRITLWSTTGNTTLIHSASLFLKAGANVLMTANDVRDFDTADGVNWREV